MQDGKYLILVIDDNPDFLQALRLMLEAAQFAVAEAKTAEEGLRVYKKTSPDLIIVDLMMEEIDAGAKFVKELKLLNNTAPVYLLSSVGDTMEASADYTALGFDGVFQKPVEPEQFINVLKAKLAN